jgi:hypothetical protein
MWTNRKIQFEVFIHNNDAKCFHVDVQGTQKMVMIGHINVKD